MLLKAVRYGLPAVLVIAGFAVLLVDLGIRRFDGFAMLVGAGLSVALLNALFRFGAVGDRYGRKLLLLLGMILTIPADCLAAWAPSIGVLFGARVIKICVDCKPYGYTADEIRLVIREAAKSGMKVEGHVQTVAGARNAVAAVDRDVDSFGHCRHRDLARRRLVVGKLHAPHRCQRRVRGRTFSTCTTLGAPRTHRLLHGDLKPLHLSLIHI